MLRKKSIPALIAQVRPTIVGCFWPVFFFADHNQGCAESCVKGGAKWALATNSAYFILDVGEGSVPLPVEIRMA